MKKFLRKNESTRARSKAASEMDDYVGEVRKPVGRGISPSIRLSIRVVQRPSESELDGRPSRSSTSLSSCSLCFSFANTRLLPAAIHRGLERSPRFESWNPQCLDLQCFASLGFAAGTGYTQSTFAASASMSSFLFMLEIPFFIRFKKTV